MNSPFTTPLDPECQPLPAVIYGNHAILLLPRGDQWEVRTTYISSVCLAPLFSSQADAFAQGKQEANADS